MGKWRRHNVEFKKEVVARMKSSDNIHELARELGLQRKLMYTWKYEFEGRPEKNHSSYAESPPAETAETRLRREIKQLKESLGEKTAELDFFAGALRRLKKDGQAIAASGDPASTPKSGRGSKRKAN
jgi:transposase-like protein